MKRCKTVYIRKGGGKRGTMEGGKLVQMKEENENISLNVCLNKY